LLPSRNEHSAGSLTMVLTRQASVAWSGELQKD
jgi:hypothetical protein